MVAFREPPVAHFDAATFDSGPLAWAARNASKPGRGGGECWVLHSDAEWSADHVEAPAEYVQQTLLEAFGSVTGAGKSEIDFLTSHRWLYARPETPGPGSQWDAAQQIGICGDWLAGGRVEDAFMSGDRLADAILGSPREAPAHDLRPVHEER
jgi:predicted NAD/FAD-dependent oxidoreductase